MKNRHAASDDKAVFRRMREVLAIDIFDNQFCGIAYCSPPIRPTAQSHALDRRVQKSSNGKPCGERNGGRESSGDDPDTAQTLAYGALWRTV